MKNKIVLSALFILLISHSAFGLQNANITLKDGNGLCMRENLCQICDNETLSLEGTSDHIIYLESSHIYDSCLTESEEIQQTENAVKGLVDLFNLKSYLYFAFMLFLGGYLIWKLR
jgi:hypothetical protein